jgi:hypothetical protein
MSRGKKIDTTSGEIQSEKTFSVTENKIIRGNIRSTVLRFQMIT